MSHPHRYTASYLTLSLSILFQQPTLFIHIATNIWTYHFLQFTVRIKIRLLVIINRIKLFYTTEPIVNVQSSINQYWEFQLGFSSQTDTSYDEKTLKRIFQRKSQHNKLHISSSRFPDWLDGSRSCNLLGVYHSFTNTTLARRENRAS